MSGDGEVAFQPCAGGRHPRVVLSAGDAQTYLDALSKFAETLKRLDIDPASLPAGSSAVAEAQVLGTVRSFIRNRYAELRRWVHPGRCVDELFSRNIEGVADKGEQAIVDYHVMADDDADNLSTWTCRSCLDACLIGDIAVDLMYFCDVLKLDFDEAMGSAEMNQCRPDGQQQNPQR